VWFNPVYLLLLLPAALAWYAQYRVRDSYVRWGRVANRYGLTGLQVADRLMQYVGLQGIEITQIPGYLTDHYDTHANGLFLSEGIANSRSVTAMGIVAHEVLHALQDAEGYPLMRMRAWLGERLAFVPQASMWLFIIGLLYRVPAVMVVAGVGMFATLVLAATALPVERNASGRALEALQEAGLATEDDLQGARDVLSSAALTYMAGIGQYVGRLLFFASLIAIALGLWQR
jgi:Zn-dependent membrane protease YugP